MPPRKIKPKRKKQSKRYSVDQCLLYKLSSPSKLAAALNLPMVELDELLGSSENYKLFTVDEERNPFSYKVKKARKVQEPKTALAKVHLRILFLLEGIQAPAYNHASVADVSYRSNALAHVKGREVATYDIKGFYDSTRSPLVYQFFLDALCCPGDVARMLTKLTTFEGNLPTGSSLSPLLALYAAKPMFDELNEIANSLNLKFTCYVDDLTFSGDSIPISLDRRIRLTLRKYGYRLAEQKTKRFAAGVPKHITGALVHEGAVKVPHARFIAVRNLTSAILGRSERHRYSVDKLKAKLAGTVNEASYLDPRFQYLSTLAAKDFKAFSERISSRR
jgi:RNA-directed DNA polymerase